MTHTTFNDLLQDVRDRLYYIRSLDVRGIPHNDAMTTEELKNLRDNTPHDWRFDQIDEV